MRKHFCLFLLFFLSLFITGTSAQPTSSLVLNGEDQLMKISSHSDFNIALDESFTVACWVKLSRFQDGQRFIAKRSMTGSPKSGYELWGGNSARQFFANNAPNENGNHDNSMSVWSSESGDLNTWTHIALVVDRAAGKMYLYQNGILAGNSGTKDISPWYVENNFDVLIGVGLASPTEYAYYMQGEIGNLRFWKKALSIDDINADKTNDIANAEGLVAAYNFENIEGLSVPDISGNNHTGVLVNYPVEGPCVVANASLTQDTNFTGRGNENEVIAKIALDMDGTNPVQCHQLVLNMNGTTNIEDVKNIKIYSTGNKNEFDPRYAEASAALLGTGTPALGEITCDLTGELTSGTNYLWITYNIAEQATEGNQVDVNLASITTDNETYTFENGTIDGSRTILLKRKLLFAPGDANSKNYRIPAIITAKDGSLVTVTDKRKYNQTDLPEDIDIVVRRSEDGGFTWSAPLTIAEGTGYRQGFGDAALVHTTEENGLLCVFVGGEGIFNNSSPSNPTRTYICKSTDNGKTWTAPRDITNQLYGSACSVEERQGWYASFCASGNGLLTSEGRIMFVAAVRENSSNTLSNFVYYSDDNGETWNVSGRAKLGGDESKVTELNDGTILMSIRRQSKGARYYVKSTDKGLTWGELSEWNEMIEPNCNGDIIRYTSTNDGYEKNRLLHSIPNNAINRENVSVFVSYDEGQTWPVKKSVCPTGSAYSSLAILPDGTIGAYVEENYNTENYSLYFNNFSLGWLTNGADTYYAPGEITVVKAPTFSAPEGEYETEVSVILESATQGASIYYTLDGSTPSESSTLYKDPITLEETTTIKAIAIKEGMANSEVATATYTIIRLGEYCIWDEESFPRTGTDRIIRTVSVAGAHLNGEAQSFTTIVAGVNATSQRKINFDNTSDVLNATMGDELVVSTTIDNLFWTHFYVYIDYNQNGIFEENEIVSYTHYSENGTTYKNSKGETVQAGTVATTLPSFTIPENVKTGVTRMRFKADWNSLDPCGDSGLAKNRGTILDFTINLYVPKKHAVNFEQPAEGGNFVVKAGDTAINSGDEIIEGTLLTVETTPAPGYKLTAINVNNQAIEGNSFTITDATVISVVFERKKTYTVTFNTPEGGTLTVKNGDEILTSGAIVEEATLLTIEAVSSDGYQIRSLLVNEVTLETSTYTVNENVTIMATFTMDKKVVFSANEGGTLVVKTVPDAIELTSGDWVENNQQIDIIAIPSEGYEIVSATLNGNDILDRIKENRSFEIKENTIIEITFAKKMYNFTYTFDGQMGKVLVKNAGAAVNSGDQLEHGTIVSVNLRPNMLYFVKSILLNGQDKTDELLSDDNNFDLTVTEDIALDIVFDAEKYTLTYNIPSHGVVNITLGESETPVTNGAEIPFGDYLTLTFTPDTGSELLSLVINGEDYLADVEDNTLYWDIDGNVTIEVAFTIPSGIENTTLGNVVTYINQSGHIVVKGAEIGSLIEVIDATGKPVVQKMVTKNVETLPAQLSSALYLIKVSHESDIVIRKIMKK